MSIGSIALSITSVVGGAALVVKGAKNWYKGHATLGKVQVCAGAMAMVAGGYSLVAMRQQAIDSEKVLPSQQVITTEILNNPYCHVSIDQCPNSRDLLNVPYCPYSTDLTSICAKKLEMGLGYLSPLSKDDFAITSSFYSEKLTKCHAQATSILGNKLIGKMKQTLTTFIPAGNCKFDVILEGLPKTGVHISLL